MSETIRFTIDGVEVDAQPGQTVMKAADAAGIYIPRLCDTEGLKPQGSCRVCVVKMNGRTVASCTQPAAAGATVENETEEIRNYRRDLVRMLFHEGNHLCPHTNSCCALPTPSARRLIPGYLPAACRRSASPGTPLHWMQVAVSVPVSGSCSW